MGTLDYLMGLGGMENTRQQQQMEEEQQGQALRWGIIGCGRISGDFARAMGHCQTANKIVALASATSLEKAEEFCMRHGLDQQQSKAEKVSCYGAYADLLADTNVDVVYVGNLTHQHKAAVLAALRAGKPVLCEKTMGVNRAEVEEIAIRARAKELFLMEAYWTRCFPLWRELMAKHVPSIGPVELVQCDFGFVVDRVASKQRVEEGGEGYLLASGCYGLMAAQMLFGGQKPVEISAKGGKKGGEREGFDIWANIQLHFPGNRMAQVFYSGEHKTAGSLSIFGKKGCIRIPEFFWSPVEAQVQLYPSEGHRKAGASRVERLLSHPLPPHDPNLFHYPHAVGLAYEIDHVNECLGEGRKESHWMGLDESVELAGTMDEIRRQLGVKYPQDIGHRIG